MIPDERLQQLISAKDPDAAPASVNAHRYIESWATYSEEVAA